MVTSAAASAKIRFYFFNLPLLVSSSSTADLAMRVGEIEGGAHLSSSCWNSSPPLGTKLRIDLFSLDP